MNPDAPPPPPLAWLTVGLACEPLLMSNDDPLRLIAAGDHCEDRHRAL